jgi:glycosyltransferase involved in cell wall biosynthesis
MMKVVFINNARLCSGAEEHLIDLGHWLSRQGVQLLFVTRNNSVFSARLMEESLPFVPCFAEAGGKVRSIARIARLLVREQPDVISVNREHNIYPTWLAVKLAGPFLKRRPKMVMVFHTPTGRHYPILRLFDGIIATSHFTAAAFLKANPGLPKNSTVIHYGIQLPPAPEPVKGVADRPRRFFRERGFPVIGMVGELWKNQEELIPITQRLVEEFPSLCVAIVGGEGQASFAHLRDGIASCGLERHFELVPRIPRSAVADVFYDFDLSVSTHRNEGFGIVHIESLAAGTPVVAYRAGGLVEILEKGGSILVDGGPPEFAGAVGQLLRGHEERTVKAAEGRRVVEAEFSLDAMGSRHLTYYQDLVDGKLT